jgi:hypothetical protein
MAPPTRQQKLVFLLEKKHSLSSDITQSQLAKAHPMFFAWYNEDSVFRGRGDDLGDLA